MIDFKQTSLLSSQALTTRFKVYIERKGARREEMVMEEEGLKDLNVSKIVTPWLLI